MQSQNFCEGLLQSTVFAKLYCFAFYFFNFNYIFYLALYCTCKIVLSCIVLHGTELHFALPFFKFIVLSCIAFLILYCIVFAKLYCFYSRVYRTEFYCFVVYF